MSSVPVDDYMKFETAKSAIDRLLVPAEGINLGFFGGEPLLNMELIKKTVEYAEHLCSKEKCLMCKGTGEQRNQQGQTNGKKCQQCGGDGRPKAKFHVTTNGTLYSPENCDFLQKHGFSLITSIDGTAEAHDALRPMKRSGKGSHKQILAGLERLKQFPIAQRNTLRSTFTAIEGETISTRCEFLNQLCDEGKGSWASVNKSLCLAGQTRIPLLDGSVRTMADLAREFSESSFWIYSIDRLTGRMAPGLAHSPRMTGEMVTILKVTLDDGQEVWCTPGHGFMLSDGEFRRADRLRSGDSLMALYRRISDGVANNEKRLKDYELFRDPQRRQWFATHVRASRRSTIAVRLNRRTGELELSEKEKDQDQRHHLNGNKLDNRPDNLAWITHSDHSAYHELENRILAAYRESEQNRLDQQRFQTGKVQEGSHPFLSENRTPAMTDWIRERVARGDFHLQKLTQTEEHRQRSAETIRKFNLEQHAAGTHPSRRQFNEGTHPFQNPTPEMRQARSEAAKRMAAEGNHGFQSNGSLASKYSWYLRRSGKSKDECPYKQFCEKRPDLEEGNHKVLTIENAGYAQVYNLKVDHHRNLLVEAGVFVHDGASTM